MWTGGRYWQNEEIEDKTELSTRPVVAGMRTQGRTIGYTNVEVVKTDANNNPKGREVFQYYVEPPLQTGDNHLATTEGTSARYEFMEARDWRNGQLLNYTAFNSTNDTIKATKRDFYLSGAPNASVNYHQDRNIKMLLYSLVSKVDYVSNAINLRNTSSGPLMMGDDFEVDGIFPSVIGTNTNLSPGPFPVFVRHNDAFLLKKETQVDYFSGGRRKSHVTEYFYDDALYPTKLTSQKESFLGENVELNTSFKYAYDKGNQLMIDRNMIDIPLETITTQTIGNVTKILEKTESIYPHSLPTPESGNLVLPLSVKSYTLSDVNVPVSEVKFDRYDSKGNLLQYTLKTGVPVSIIWGYASTKPIAKVEGATYDQLMSLGLVSGLQSASDQDSLNPSMEVAFINVLDSFRNNSSISLSKITTYTYDPLIGVTSITPPSGIREVYIYDGSNRLKEIRENDKTGNIIKEFNYNYKP
ncbi:hypothetical protein [Chryseobacterium sp. JUb7]|uniref:hypothetical protein n=1 Tax=Chryseobacterium sp. JUb7 TaxID=2940599 RepID=UPI00216A07FC|nr:hypothetical protein [Chryseobacterium sp. JUb7]MCS3533061.1 hypothetical protein [Chryseobacterium sp. JUb7]